MKPLHLAKRPWYGLPFLAVLVLFYIHAFQGWHFSLGGSQSFRQAQTAIATQYIAEEGPMLRTRIPVLGPDWHIAFEFPTYQHVVGAWHTLTGMSLETSGRSISLLFFTGCIPLFWWILRAFGMDRALSSVVLGLLLVSPTMLYNSRNFLIESCALFWTLGFVAALLRYEQRGERWSMVFLCLTGLLAALTKFTTFSIGLGFAILWLLAHWTMLRGKEEPAIPWSRLGTLAGVMAGMVMAALLWKLYLDGQWERFPATIHFADNIGSWNFGTWEKRMDGDFWGRFVEFGMNHAGLSWLPWLLTLPLFTMATYRWRILALCALAAWLSGPLVWSNLFYVHHYYYYANTWLAFLWMGASLAGVLERWPRLRIPLLSAAWLVVMAMGLGYRTTGYYENQKNDWGSGTVAFAKEVGETVAPGEVLLILGDDWNPLIPLYAERYAVMLRWEGYAKGPRFQKVLQQVEAEGKRFGGMVIRKARPMPVNQTYLRQRYSFANEPALRSTNDRFLFFPAQESP